jgi:hypothetical protein
VRYCDCEQSYGTTLNLPNAGDDSQLAFRKEVCILPTHDLDSNLRTVLHLAPFFEELKSQARELASQTKANERGYFSTREEEATSRLLVSYWHARNALFDLIGNLRRAPELPPEEQARSFVVGFSASLLLVDAARFLREAVESRPVVKRKLNEASPAFGIPAGVYDTIQKALLSTRNGWHLYHAVQYFNQNQAALDETAAGTDMETLLAVIRRLRHRLDVPASQFAIAKLRSRGMRLGSRLRHTLFGRAMYGLQKLAGTLVADKYLRIGHQPALPSTIAQEFQGLLHTGDVLVVRKEYALTNYFLPGYWPHAAVFLGNTTALRQLKGVNQEKLQPHWARLDELTSGDNIVMESMRDGVRLRPLSSPFGSDSIVVIRPQLAPSDVSEALCRCLSHQGKPYDFNFDFSRSDRLVCTEVVYRAFDGVGAMDLPLIHRIGRPSLSGDDLISMALAGQSFDAVAVYAPTFSDRIATGTQAQRLINRARGTEPSH